MQARLALLLTVVSSCFSPPIGSIAAGSLPDLSAHLVIPTRGRSASPFAVGATSTPIPRSPGVSVAIPDGAGGTYVAWSDFYRDNSDNDVILLRVTNAGAPAAGWPADGIPLSAAAGSQFFTAGPVGLVPDGANGVILVWAEVRGSGHVLDFYAQRVSAAGVPQWAANGVMLRSNVLDIDQRLASDGAGGVVAAWSTKGAVDLDIFASRINGAGAVPAGWSTAGVLVCAAVDDQIGPVISRDGAGGAVIAWEDARAGGGENHVYTQRLDGSGAAQWAANGVLMDGVVGAGTPLVCSDGGTGAIMFWSDGISTTAQRLNSAGAEQWTPGGVAVDGSGRALACTPDGAGGAFVCWTDILGGAIGAQRVNSAGVSQWGASGASVVGSGSLIAQDVDIVPDGTGAAYFVWSDLRNYLTSSDFPELFAQRITSTGGTSWAADGVKVTGTTAGPYGGTNSLATAALDGSQGLLVAWANSANVTSDIFVQRFTSAGAAQFGPNGLTVFRYPGVQVGGGLIQADDGGVFAFTTEPENGRWWAGRMQLRRFDANGVPTSLTEICPVAVYPRATSVIEDGAGGVIVVWTDRRNGNDDLYAQRFNISGSPQWTANGVPICIAAGTQDAARMIPDGAGGAIISWYDARNPANWDLYVQRINSAGAVQWAANGLAVCAEASNQSPGDIVPDGAGGAIISWTDIRNGPGGQIYAQRIDGSGAPQWTVDGTSVATYAGNPSVWVAGSVRGAANDAILLIMEYLVDPLLVGTVFEPNRLVLHAQKVSSAGSAQWGAGGITISDAASTSAGGSILDDGAGGIYAAWGDDRGGAFNLYMQRYNSAGTGQWTAGGIVVCNAPGSRGPGGFTRDPAGDLYLSWHDTRGGLPDIYTQRVSTLGVPQWTANGVLVCGAARGQFIAAMAPFKASAPGRVFVAWADNRAGDRRFMYLQRLDLNGNPQWTADGVTRIALSLASAEANTERVRMTWYASEYLSATVERRTEESDWTAIGRVSSDGSGRIAFEDRAITPGLRYGYRLAFMDEGRQTSAGEAWVEVPTGLQFGIDGAVPSPATGHWLVSFTLPSANPATLEMIDIAGRRVLERQLTGHAPGRQTMSLGNAGLPAGVYFLRLRQDGLSATSRVAVVQ